MPEWNPNRGKIGQLDPELAVYLVAVTWTDRPDGSKAKCWHDLDHFDPSAIKRARADLDEFKIKAAALGVLQDDLDRWEDFSGQTWETDFWLTRNGHGCGFWEEEGTIAERLDQVAKSMGPCYTWAAHGRIYLEREC